jgi:tellurite resistance protein TerB
MSIFSSLRDAAKGLIAEADKHLSRVTSKGTFERVVQACYLVAAADGNVSDEEKVITGKVIARKLPNFKAGEVAKALDAAADEMALSAVAGKLTLMENISKAANTDDAKIIMLGVLAVANADNEFSASEQTVAREIIRNLGLRASDYGL